MSLVLAVLVASLLGSVHCAAMCGAFVCFYASNPATTAWRANAAGHLAYNLGRLVSYLALGTLAGTVGGVLNRTGLLVGVSQVAALVAGTLMILWGIASYLTAVGVRGLLPAVPDAWRHAMGAVLLDVRERPPITRAAVTGLVTTLLPCGWLYAFVVTATGAGTPWRGAAVMVVFWLGTLPMMLTVGYGAQRLFGPLRKHLPMVSPLVVVVLGVLAIANHFGILPGMQWLHFMTPGLPAADLTGLLPMHSHS